MKSDALTTTLPSHPPTSINHMGGRHYSDRLCADRRYSNNPQSGRPSTSLAHLDICRNSRNWEKTTRIGSRRRMHRKHGIDRGTEVTEGSGVWGGYPCGVWGAPSSGKVTTYVPPTHYCTAPDFRHLVPHLSNRYCPWAYSTAVSHPTSRLTCTCTYVVMSGEAGCFKCPYLPSRTCQVGF